MNSQFIEGILEINTRSFFRYEENDNKRFWCIAGYVFKYATERIYNNWVREKEIEPLEKLPQEKKEKYWKMANLFCPDKSVGEKMASSRAAYILELITSTF